MCSSSEWPNMVLQMTNENLEFSSSNITKSVVTSTESYSSFKVINMISQESTNKINVLAAMQQLPQCAVGGN